LPEGQTFADDFHVYSIEWEPGEIRWYIDGKLYHVANDWYSRDPYLADDYTYPAPFDQNFFLILNISVGGGWPGYPDETTVFPQQMVVDYVRVYQKDKYPHREKPAKEEVKPREPLEDGNYIYNGGLMWMILQQLVWTVFLYVLLDILNSIRWSCDSQCRGRCYARTDRKRRDNRLRRTIASSSDSS